MKNIIKISLAMLSVAVLLPGCKKYENADRDYPAWATTTLSIAQLKTMYVAPTGGKVPVIATDDVIAGTVISTDVLGNNYRSLYIQDDSGGIEVKVGRGQLYNDYKIGQTVYIKLKGLALGKYGGQVNLGTQSPNPKYETAYIEPQYWIDRVIAKGQFGLQPTPTVISSSSAITDADLYTWVTLTGMTWKGASSSYPAGQSTWAQPGNYVDPDDPDASSSSYTSQYFNFADGGEVQVRTSTYARFAGVAVPTGTVSLTGVLTKYNNYIQMSLNSDLDVKPQ